jgi:hypothetical protein
MVRNQVNAAGSRTRVNQPAQSIAELSLLALAALAYGCSAYDPSLLPSAGAMAQTGAGASGNLVLPNADAGIVDNCLDNMSTQVCRRPNADATCVAGQCLIAGCKAPYVDCDQNEDNGCETTLDTPEHCGLCGAACRFSHAAGGCADGHCAVADCDEGFANCDGDDSNGCETTVNTISDCGACGHACPQAPHAVAGCIGGACAVTSCIGAFADCNSRIDDGCEQPLNSSDNCGACGASCMLPNAANASCASGSCVVSTCTGSFSDCNGLPADGCEARLDSAGNCGACGAKCALPHVERTLCAVASAATSCAIDHGCAPDDNACKPGDPNNGCSKGYSDCDQNPSNGCEVALSRVTDCGACKKSCLLDHTLRACQDGQCATLGCASGYAQCGGADCKSLLDDPLNCGQCGTNCSGTTPNCAGGKCTGSSCSAGTADCDARTDNNCETNLNDAYNCGGCGLRCDRLPHAAASCLSGACRVGRCDAGFDDCDGDPNNGCETDLSTASDCGKCGVACNYPNGSGSCRNGRCQLTGCDTGRADCNTNPNDGCEADLQLPSNCGACGRVCAQAQNVVSSSCGAMGCSFICQAGFADCDGRADNGCEANLSDARSCGACGKNCSGSGHVSSADCAAGVCQNIKCDAGFADCNGDPSDGCERAINTRSDCGRCDQACAPAHATGTCGAGQCQIASCDSGFGDCDGNPQNGCETTLNTTNHCGACGTVCAVGSTCQNGACGCGGASDCPSGQSCCSGHCASTAGACFPFPCVPGTDLGANRLNCGACGQACLLWCCAVP